MITFTSIRLRTKALCIVAIPLVIILVWSGYIHWENSYCGKVVTESKCPNSNSVVRVRAMPHEPILALLFVTGAGFWYRCEWSSSEDDRLYSAKFYGTQSYEAISVQILWTAPDEATVIFNDGDVKLECNHGNWKN
jgi:hypothetical protein